MFKVCTHCTAAHQELFSAKRRKCPKCKAGSYLLRPATEEEMIARNAKIAKREAFIQSLLED